MPIAMSKQKTVFYFPYHSPQNRYLELMQDAWQQLGFDVADVRDIWRLKSLGSYTGSVAVLNWLEENIARKSQYAWYAWPLFLVKFYLLKVLGLSIICIRHNRLPVDSVPDKQMAIFNRVVRFLEARADAVIVHSKSEAEQRGFFYVPHPVYPVQALESDKPSEPSFLCFGKLKHYKKVHELLEIWPPEAPLVLAGEVEQHSYEIQLREIIDRRQLTVCCDFRRFSDDEIDRYLCSSTAALVPYIDQHCYVSGVLIHALSAGLPVITRASAFAESLQQQGLPVVFYHDQVTLLQCFAKVQQLDLAQASINATNGAPAIATALADMITAIERPAIKICLDDK